MSVDTSDLDRLAAQLVKAGVVAEHGRNVVVKAAVTATVEAAKANAHVLSGELRDSISGTANGSKGKVTARSKHAWFNEVGTSRMAPIPFMLPALETTAPGFIAAMAKLADI
jgi:HK97 gp10 family phage protein